jgi:hypothetical protein
MSVFGIFQREVQTGAILFKEGKGADGQVLTGY